MKKILLSLLAVFAVTSTATAADDVKKTNPIFGEYQNQVSLNIGQGVNSFGLVPAPDMAVPYNMIQFAYSQPVTVFRLSARQNFNVTQLIGYGKKYQYTDYFGTFEWDWANYNTTIASITWDVTFFHGDDWYFGAGTGLAMQGRQTERECTKLLIPFKVFFGYSISDKWNVEIFTQHFSNGDAGGEGFVNPNLVHGGNYSYNFWGLGVSYNF